MWPRLHSTIAAVWLISAGPAFVQVPPESTPYVRALRSGTIDERTAAARWLGLHLETDAMPVLAQALADTPRDAAHAEFVRTAELMLGILRRPRNLEFRSLADVTVGLDDPEPHVRASAVRHLAYYAPPDGADRAAAFLTADDALVRDEAVTALRYLGDRNHSAEVLAMLDDPGAAVRIRALEYLLEFDRPDWLPRLVAIAADPSPWIAQAAVRVLRARGVGAAAAAAIFDKLDAAAAPFVLTRRLEALDRLGDREKWPRRWTDEVRPLLAHADGAVRHRAALLLGAGDTGAARDVLLDLLESDDEIERLSAAQGLAASDWTVAADRIAALLDDGTAAVRVAAVDLTTRLPPAEQRVLLRRVLDRTDEAPDVQSRALAGFAEVGTADDVGFLVERVRAADSEHVRINAALAMAALERRFDTRDAREWFREQLGDPSVGRPTRQAVVRALQVNGDPSFLPLLAEELRGIPAPDPWYAAAVIQTMSVLVGRQVHGADFAESGVP